MSSPRVCGLDQMGKHCPADRDIHRHVDDSGYTFCVTGIILWRVRGNKNVIAIVIGVLQVVLVEKADVFEPRHHVIAQERLVTGGQIVVPIGLYIHPPAEIQY